MATANNRHQPSGGTVPIVPSGSAAGHGAVSPGGGHANQGNVHTSASNNRVAPGGRGVGPAARGVGPAARGVGPAARGVGPAARGVGPAARGVGPGGLSPGSFFTQNTWVTITGLHFNPARPIVGGITGTSVVTYIEPRTGKTGTLRVQGKTVAGNPQKCPDNESFCLTRAGGVGGQLLVSPTGNILDSKP